MIFRAVFWIGLVSLLTPHEPDLGLGRPGAGTASSTPTALSSPATGLSRADGSCATVCAGGLGGMLQLLHLDSNGTVTAGLADVKAQIEADQRARALRSGAI